MNTDELDMTPRYAPEEVLMVTGNKTIGNYGVQLAIFHPAGTHSGPIRKDWGALELVTAVGSRWYGCVHAYINAELRAVIVGTNPQDEVRMKWPVVPEELR